MKVGDGWWVSMALTSAMPRNRYVEYIITKEFCVCVCVKGYDGLFFGRLDHQDKLERIDKKTMEMIWSTTSLGK